MTEEPFTILAVDDDPVILSVLSNILRAEDYRVLTSENADDALLLLNKVYPDLIISDIHMPGSMGGIEFGRLVKENTPDIPLVFLTANPDDALVGFEIGAEDYITKPFEPQVLAARVKAILRRTSRKKNEESLLDIPNYVILDKIGAGGFSMVYKAQDKHTGEVIAIKKLLESPTTNPEEQLTALQRFMQEAKTLRELSHPNLIRIISVISKPHNCIVMEYLDGQTLATLLQEQHPLSNQQLCHIALEVARGLQYAHQCHVIHRDIKPENIFILPSGCIKLTDFGIARNTTADVSITTTGSVLGTIAYASPEQLMDSKHVTHLSDMFSYGIMLYELATGQRPFLGGSPGKVIINIINQPVIPPSELRPDLDSQLEAIIMRCLEKRPESRFSNMDEIINILEKQ